LLDLHLIVFGKFALMEDRLLYKITVHGRVQGVGFRRTAVREARLRDLDGIVRNMSDGSVYIEAEGTREALDDFLEWCHEGTPFSRVRSVDCSTFPPSGYDEFNIED